MLDFLAMSWPNRILLGIALVLILVVWGIAFAGANDVCRGHSGVMGTEEVDGQPLTLCWDGHITESQH